MNINKLALAAILAPVLIFSGGAQAETVRDCVVEGTVKRQKGDSEKVYVAFHSAKPAEKGASCRMRNREKLRFKAPSSEGLQDAEPGTRLKYRYTEDSEKGSTWKLQKAST